MNQIVQDTIAIITVLFGAGGFGVLIKTYLIDKPKVKAEIEISSRNLDKIEFNTLLQTYQNLIEGYKKDKKCEQKFSFIRSQIRWQPY